MRSTSDIVFGVAGQSLLYRVPQGRPSAATFQVFAESAADDGTVEFSGTATIEDVNTTLDAAAGIGQDDRTVMSLATGGGTNVTVGRRYLVEGAGRKEWALIVGKDGDDIYTSAPLMNAYESGATLKGTHVSAAIDNTWVADESHLKADPSDPAPAYRVRLLITVGGVDTVAYTFFDLVRGAIGHGITLHDVEARFWNLLDNCPVDHRADGGARLLDAAWQDVQSDLAAGHMNDGALRDAQLVDALLIRRVRLMFAENGQRPAEMTGDRFLEFAKNDYERFLEKHFLVASKVTAARSPGSGATKASLPRFFHK